MSLSPDNMPAAWYKPGALKRADTYRDQPGNSVVYLCAEKLNKKAAGEWFFAWDIPAQNGGPQARRFLRIEQDGAQWFMRTPSGLLADVQGTASNNMGGQYVKEYPLGHLDFARRTTLENIGTDILELGVRPIGCSCDWAKYVLEDCVSRGLFPEKRVKQVKQAALDQNDPRKSAFIQVATRNDRAYCISQMHRRVARACLPMCGREMHSKSAARPAGGSGGGGLCGKRIWPCCTIYLCSLTTPR